MACRNRTYVAAIALTLGLCTSSFAAGMNADTTSAWNGIMGQEPLHISSSNHVFLTGVSSSIMEHCGRPSDPLQQVRLSRFLADGYAAVVMSRGAASRREIERDPVLTAGRRAARTLACPEALQALGRISGVLRRRAETRPTTAFVASCEAGHAQEACRCVEEVASDVLPGIGAMAYGSAVYARLFEKDPFLTIQIPRLCGVDH